MTRFIISWLLYSAGCCFSFLANTDNPFSRRWGWPYSIYSFFMVSSEQVQGHSNGPWKDAT